jgi:hypothetical protein
MRRALIAYWSEPLADLREGSAKSTYARYHSYDPVAELLEYKRATEDVFIAPNAPTRKALQEARGRKNIESFESVGAWSKKMRSA